MVDQASLETRQSNGHTSASAGVRNGIGELLYDVVSLGELQAQLLVVDARESLQKAQTPLVMLVVGAVIGLGATPVLLIAAAEALTELAGWDRWLSYLTSGLVGAALGGLLMYLAWRQAGDVIAVFLRSRTELAENIRWIKYALTRGKQPPR